MKIFSAFILLFALTISPINGKTIPQFEEANAAYGRGEYAKSIQLYGEIPPIKQTVEVHINKALAEAGEGHLGLCSFHLHRALALHGQGFSVLRAIDAISRSSGVTCCKHGWAQYVAHICSVGGWILLAVASLWMGLFSITFHITLPHLRKISVFTCYLSISLLCLSIFGASMLTRELDDGIIVHTTPAYDIPSMNSKPVCMVHEGTRVNIRTQHNDLFLVELPSKSELYVPCKNCFFVGMTP
jgi:hypothetical protein